LYWLRFGYFIGGGSGGVGFSSMGSYNRSHAPTPRFVSGKLKPKPVREAVLINPPIPSPPHKRSPSN
jgi:hypothetical protein